MTDVALQKPASTQDVFRAQLTKMEPEFALALPTHIPKERFMRVVLTAVNANPKLLNADRRSLFESAMKAAQDGLLPDGREGAFSTFNTKTNVGGRDEWIDKVTWMPMIAGLRKKVRNSDTIATWDVQAVYKKDEFEFELGDDPFIKHRPSLDKDRGPLVAVYSIATLKSGEKSRDVMSVHEVEYVRDNYSKKDKKGNFSPAWTKSFSEMAKKTVARRHSKVLPMSTDLDDLLRRDDELYDLKGGGDADIQLQALRAPEQNPFADEDDIGDAAGADEDAGADEPEKECENSDDAPRSSEQAAVGREGNSSKASGSKTGDDAPTAADPNPEDGEAGDAGPLTTAASSGKAAGDAAGVAPVDARGAPAAVNPLLDKARAKAIQGRKKFELWWRSLSIADADSLGPHIKVLLEAADAADRVDE